MEPWRRFAAFSSALTLSMLVVACVAGDVHIQTAASAAPRRLNGRDIVAELMEARVERAKALQGVAPNAGPRPSTSGVPPEPLDLSTVRQRRATYYDPINSPLPEVAQHVTISVQHGAKKDVNKVILEDVTKEKNARFSAGAATSSSASLLPSASSLPLVVLVAGAGALHAWPTLLLLDGARTTPLASCGGGSSARFDLVLLVPHDDKSSVLPCFGSQGCDKGGIALGASGLAVVHGLASSSLNEDDLAWEAVKLWDQGSHSALVVVSASALVSASSLERLFAAVRPSVSPAKLDVALPVAWGLFGGGGGANALNKVYACSAEDLAFAAHPLNPARVQAALDALPADHEVVHDSGVFGDYSKDGPNDSAGLSAVALSPKAVKRLRDAKPGKGLVHILRKLVRTDAEVEVGILRRAFAHWNGKYQTNALEAMRDFTSTPLTQQRAQPIMGKAGTLVAICAAGVPDKTLAAIFSLEADLGRLEAQCAANSGDPFACSAFDLVVGVSPFPGDRTADFLEMGGIALIRQPAPLGLSDLWNRIVRFAFKEKGYARLIMSNNDVLIPPGAVGGTVALIRAHPNKVATVLSQKGGGTEALGANGTPLDKAPEEVLKFAEHAINFRVVQSHLSRSTGSCGSHPVAVPIIERKSFIGFFWGISKEMVDRLLLKDGTGRLFNTTARLNFGQETELMDRAGGGANVLLNLATYVHHFRGQTLGGCQNGHRNCAQWQLGHHADASYHINGYAPKKDTPRPVPWWEPAFGNDSPSAWKEPKRA